MPGDLTSLPFFPFFFFFSFQLHPFEVLVARPNRNKSLSISSSRHELNRILRYFERNAAGRPHGFRQILRYEFPPGNDAKEMKLGCRLPTIIYAAVDSSKSRVLLSEPNVAPETPVMALTSSAFPLQVGLVFTHPHCPPLRRKRGGEVALSDL